MSEKDYISELRARWPKDSDASLDIIALADEAVQLFPNSATLWTMRGNLIELGPESCPHPLEDSLASYQNAVRIDPEFAEAWNEIGHYYDAVLDDPQTASQYFDRANEIAKSQSSE